MDGLVNALRNNADHYAFTGDNGLVHLLTDAADAIEFLLTYKVCFENMVQIGGWWLVGRDKALHRMNVPMNWPPEGTKTVEVFPLPEPQEKATDG